MKIRWTGLELLHADGQTRHDKANAHIFQTFVNTLSRTYT
jgi:hypothetical protein